MSLAKPKSEITTLKLQLQQRNATKLQGSMRKSARQNIG